MFPITYNVNKSYCIDINNKRQDKKTIHHVAINNHTLSHTTKSKYLGLLMMMILPGKKNVFMIRQML